jgi:soluble lytic murein transglycosylase
MDRPYLVPALATLALAVTSLACAAAEATPAAPAEVPASAAPAAPEASSPPAGASSATASVAPAEAVAAPESGDPVAAAYAAPASGAGPVFREDELAPYFAAGDLKKAREKYDDGQYAEAAALLRAADDGSPGVAYLRALATMNAGDPRDAARQLRDLAPRYEALSDRLAWHEGMADERAGDVRAAAYAYGRVVPGSPLADDARLAEARMRRKFDPAGALAALAPLLERPAPIGGYGRDVAADALMLAGEIQAASGNKAAARDAYRRIWAEHALASEAVDARQRADALGAPPPTPAERLARAQVFLSAQKNREAVELLEKLGTEIALPDPTACEARFALGKGYRKLRLHAKAIATLEPVVARCTERNLLARALYLLGTSTSIVAPERGIEVYERLAAEYPEHSFADDALLYVADLHMKAGNLAGARDALQRLVDRYPDGDFRADALFRLFWLDRGDGEAERGLAVLRLLEQDYGNADDPVDLERSLYWQGRTLVELGRKIEAGATWEKLIREHPAGYYAMLARGRLAAVDPVLAARVEAQLPDPPAELPPLELHVDGLRADPHYRAAIELFRLGFQRAAADELWAVDRKAVRARGGVEPVLLVAYLLDRADARQAAHAIARSEAKALLRGRPEADAVLPYRIAYPRAYRDLIERHAVAFGVPPDLMQALMREESALDPDVVSWAGAVGLTQLMPGTAKLVAKRHKLRVPSAAQLKNPDLNVKLGTAYMADLLAMWKGNPALACASYNAGEGAVKRWLADRGRRDLDEFVEEIPIKETRDYVKRVLKSFNAYRLTYGKGEDRFLALTPAKADPKVAVE